MLEKYIQRKEEGECMNKNIQWIPVKDRLPDSDVAVLAVCMDDITNYGHPYAYEEAVILAFYSSGRWWDEIWPEKNKEDNEIEGVTHWMPLPAPPEN